MADTRKPEPIDEDQLKAIIDKEMHTSFGYLSGRLTEKRRKALYYYEGEAKGDLAPPSVPGRSTAVSTDVMEVIEGIMPRLVKIFTAGDNAVEFTARTPDQEQNAELATEYLNYLFYKRNDGFMTLSTWFKDALLAGNGVVKVYWDKTAEEEREEYKGLTDMELTMILDDPDVEIVEHSAYEAAA